MPSTSLTQIDKQNLSAETVLTVVAVNVVMLMLLELPLIGYSIAPEWPSSAVERLKDWLARNGQRAAVIGATVIGFALIQKCLLLTHSGTLFSVFRAGVRVADVRPMGGYVVEAIETELRAEQLPAGTFAQLDRTDVRIAKTASRSTLGYMKEMAFELEWSIASDGGLDGVDIDELNHALRRQLRSHGRDYARPIELVNEHLANPHRPANA